MSVTKNIILGLLIVWFFQPYTISAIDDEINNSPEYPVYRFDKMKKWYQYYSEKLGITVTPKDNRLLLQEIVSWMGTPYHYGHSSKTGTDCSGFVGQVYQKAYSIFLPRSAAAIFKEKTMIKVPSTDLQLGDLLFFGTGSGRVSHIGIYLKEGKFVHASSLRRRGVIVARLDSHYHQQRFVGAGRYHQPNPMLDFQPKNYLVDQLPVAQVSFLSIDSIDYSLPPLRTIEIVTTADPKLISETTPDITLETQIITASISETVVINPANTLKIKQEESTTITSEPISKIISKVTPEKVLEECHQEEEIAVIPTPKKIILLETEKISQNSVQNVFTRGRLVR